MDSGSRSLIALVVVATTFVAAPAAAYVRADLGLLPDGDTRPTIQSVHLEAPGRHNELLEASLVIEASDNDGIARYEYRWNSATVGRSGETDAEHPTVSYAGTRPESRYALEVRAVDVHNNGSDWFPAWSGTTPSVPHVIVVGDSIASGYTRQWFTGQATCQDREYSFGRALTDEIAATLPAVWAPRYTNIAWAGASVGELMTGGRDACGVSHPSQVDQIEALAAGDTWNLVVVTAGINSTNWTDVVVALTVDTAVSVIRRGDRAACESAVMRTWNVADRSRHITERTAEVVDALTTTTNGRIFWTSYYDITRTELAPLWQPIRGSCSNEMGYALDELHSAQRAGLSEDVTWIDIDKDIATQFWAGWPHPNSEGHATIGRVVSSEILDG
ncbi:MAG: SGNH/GDSL hydrolase family protein [Acidimicrobiia bacterium]